MSIETPDLSSPNAPQGIQRLANIQALRGIAALLVVVSHLFSIETKYSVDQLTGNWIEFGMVGVDIFFVISGFIMVHVAWSSRRGIQPAFAFLFARVTRIYPLYWLISLALLAVYLLRPDMVFAANAEAPHFIRSFFLFPDRQPPFLVIGWTLIHELGFYLVFTLALLLKPRWLLPFLIVWTIVIMGGQKIGFNMHGPVSYMFFSPLTYEFLAGAFAAYLFHKVGARFGRTILLLGLGLWAATLFMLISGGHGMIGSMWGRTIHFVLPSVLVVYGLASLKTDLPKPMQTLGNWSYALYLSHILSLSLFGRVWHQFTQNGPQNSLWDNWIALPLLTIASIAVAGIIHTLAERPMLNVTKALKNKLFS